MSFGPRVRRVVVAGELLEQVLRTGYAPPARILEGLPEGARFLSGGTLGGDRDLVLLFEHDSFEPWHPAGEAAPVQPILVGTGVAPLRVVPGDVVVVRYPRALSPTERSGIRDQLQQVLEHHFGFKVRALVLDAGGELGGLLRATNGNGGR